MTDTETEGAAKGGIDGSASESPGEDSKSRQGKLHAEESAEKHPHLPEEKRQGFGGKLVAFIRRWRYGKPPHPDREIRHIQNQEEMIRWLRINARLLTPLHSFYRGIALGLGIVVGTGIVLSLLIHLFAKLALVPLIGDFARQILNYLEATNGTH